MKKLRWACLVLSLALLGGCLSLPPGYGEDAPALASATREATASPAPTPSPSPVPSREPGGSIRIPTPTPSPALAETPSPSPSPAPTPAPTATPKPTATPSPTPEPTPTPTPRIDPRTRFDPPTQDAPDVGLPLPKPDEEVVRHGDLSPVLLYVIYYGDITHPGIMLEMSLRMVGQGGDFHPPDSFGVGDPPESFSDFFSKVEIAEENLRTRGALYYSIPYEALQGDETFSLYLDGHRIARGRMAGMPTTLHHTDATYDVWGRIAIEEVYHPMYYDPDNPEGKPIVAINGDWEAMPRTPVVTDWSGSIAVDFDGDGEEDALEFTLRDDTVCATISHGDRSVELDLGPRNSLNGWNRGETDCSEHLIGVYDLDGDGTMEILLWDFTGGFHQLVLVSFRDGDIETMMLP